MPTNRQLSEKYRPTDWQEVVGQEEICWSLATFHGRDNLAGQAYWISGRSGCGKTTIARIIANKISDKFHTVEIDASELTVAMLKEIQEVFMYRPMSCGSRCYIVNEAHGLTKEQVRRLLKVTEAPYLNECMTWVFTTTLEGQITFADGKEDAGPLLSRCIRYELEETEANAAMATRLHEIARLENLDGQDYAAYEALLVDDCASNMREALQVIARGGMMSPITRSSPVPPRRRTA